MEKKLLRYRRPAKTITAIAVVICFIISISIKAQVSPASHVILISIDGLRPEMYEDKSWPTPHLQQLMKEGTYAMYMQGVFPSFTYPSHTAMMTGALPARSKIIFNQPIGSKGEWYWYADSIKVPTLWQKLKAAGKTTAAIMWPVTVGEDIDYNLSELWDVKHPDDRITEARKYATPKGIIEQVEQNATGTLDSTNMNDSYFSMDENLGKMASYLIKKYKPGLLALHMTSVDENEHDYGREHDSVRLAVGMNDRIVGEVLDAIDQAGIKENTTVIIVGDHGFATINQVMRPNMLIKDLGVRFVPSGGSAFLYSPAKGEKLNEQQKEATVKTVKERLNNLPEEQRKLFRIIERKELDAMGADSAAILALTGQPGLVFSGSNGPAQSVNQGPGTLTQQNKLEGLFYPYHGGHHGYDPNIPEMHTGFIAAGAGINKGKVIDKITEPDIATLIARLLGIEFTTPDGKLVKGILKL